MSDYNNRWHSRAALIMLLFAIIIIGLMLLNEGAVFDELSEFFKKIVGKVMEFCSKDETCKNPLYRYR